MGTPIHAPHRRPCALGRVHVAVCTCTGVCANVAHLMALAIKWGHQFAVHTAGRVHVHLCTVPRVVVKNFRRHTRWQRGKRRVDTTLLFSSLFLSHFWLDVSPLCVPRSFFKRTQRQTCVLAHKKVLIFTFFLLFFFKNSPQKCVKK